MTEQVLVDLRELDFHVLEVQEGQGDQLALFNSLDGVHAQGARVSELSFPVVGSCLWLRSVLRRVRVDFLGT